MYFLSYNTELFGNQLILSYSITKTKLIAELMTKGKIFTLNQENLKFLECLRFNNINCVYHTVLHEKKSDIIERHI